VSAEDGSNALLSESWKLEPSSTGPVFENVAVGATFVTVTLSVYSVVPPSLSRILALTARMPSSLVGQVAVSAAENAP
jgi:hypothetical protein